MKKKLRKDKKKEKLIAVHQKLQKQNENCDKKNLK